MLSALVGWMIAAMMGLLGAAVFAVFGDATQREKRLWWIMGLLAPVIMILLIALNTTTAPCL
ncbi:hypothetical protein [Pseudomonas phage D6]|nr:hypothetical protein [Pseudomonas phage D6]